MRKKRARILKDVARKWAKELGIPKMKGLLRQVKKLYKQKELK